MKPTDDELMLRRAEHHIERLLETIEKHCEVRTKSVYEDEPCVVQTRMALTRRFLKELRARVMVSWGYSGDHPRCSHDLPVGGQHGCRLCTGTLRLLD